MGASSWLFAFSATTTAPPTGNQIRLDAGAPYDAVTRAWVRYVTTDGMDVFYGLLAIAAGDTLYLQDKDDHTRALQLAVTGAPIDQGGYVEIPVQLVAATTALPAQTVALVVLTPDAGTPIPPIPAPPGGPLTFSRVTLAGPLWTVEEAKALQFKLTGAADDADVAQKLAVAQEVIIAYLFKAADPSWTPTTAPQGVKHAILLLAEHYFEHRGDDMSGPGGQVPDAKTWEAIWNLISPYRDPTLA